MRFRRTAGAAALIAAVAGASVLSTHGVGAATTSPPAATPISLEATGMGASFCPVPLNQSVAVRPSGANPALKVLFSPGFILTGQKLTLTVLNTAKTVPPQSASSYDVPARGVTVSFPAAGTYNLDWTTAPLGLGLGATISHTGTLIIDPAAQKCTVGVQVPVPSVSAPAVPAPVTGAVNGVLGTVAGAANGALNPVNGAVGPLLGGVNGTVGSNIGKATGGSSTSTGSQFGTTYKPTGPTVAQRTVPQGYGNGSGAAGSYVYGGSNGASINAPAAGSAGSGNSGANPLAKSGGTPKTVDLAASKPRLALDGWSTIAVLLALLALSGATALYARTFLLQPTAAPARG